MSCLVSWTNDRQLQGSLNTTGNLEKKTVFFKLRIPLYHQIIYLLLAPQNIKTMINQENAVCFVLKRPPGIAIPKEKKLNIPEEWRCIATTTFSISMATEEGRRDLSQYCAPVSRGGFTFSKKKMEKELKSLFRGQGAKEVRWNPEVPAGPPPPYSVPVLPQIEGPFEELFGEPSQKRKHDEVAETEEPPWKWQRASPSVQETAGYHSVSPANTFRTKSTVPNTDPKVRMERKRDNDEMEKKKYNDNVEKKKGNDVQNQFVLEWIQDVDSRNSNPLRDDIQDGIHDILKRIKDMVKKELASIKQEALEMVESRWSEKALDIFLCDFTNEDMDLQIKISEKLVYNENTAMMFYKFPPRLREHWIKTFATKLGGTSQG
jgi:hypothetical protein